jgi:hypothetical protein
MLYTKEGARELLTAIVDATGTSIGAISDETAEAFYQFILENKD